MDWQIALLFFPTFFLVSITPGLCMTLALTLGIRYGVRRTLWMMWGELLGVALVAVSSVMGVAALLLSFPVAFTILKVVGGGYLIYLGIKSWRQAVGEFHLANTSISSAKALFSQGFITAIANPKGWAFMVALLPPFINEAKPLAPQLTTLVLVIFCTEFISLLAYASGGRSLRKLLERPGNAQLLERISGTVMIALGVWLFAT